MATMPNNISIISIKRDSYYNANGDMSEVVSACYSTAIAIPGEEVEGNE